ncbi:hypothetical protein CC85DRAFT_288383 [Cutaneotrichosporon oleaginosum]|uniref:Uncharacterized protein n=1 Tax=Cutaneotrichosporon oleaginosum TaxID=879819 RepID=A0A0J0XET3_9TREE|nr:uncharacterized protein CC85DRAFT_288383 [Cutaneotrichosporon oleaginosum]KLT39587.1 hypothetical protein CC85DRAFT_288383 [Cutaneotrichosporon oleaginosum]TXT15485.1 hypothetical protein COLE_01678 [Cutaneotrichosporon oleaginosum]
MVEYGHLLPHRPDTRMATLDLMFVAASALPEDEGDVVAALISDAWEALNAALHGPEPVRGEESEDGDDESEPRPSITSEARSPCPCGGRCGAVCEYEAAVGPQPLRRLAKRRSFRRRQVLSPLPEIGEAGPSRPRKSAMRSASRDLKFWDRSRFKAGPSGSQGLDMLHAFLEREADKAAAEAGETRKGKEREVPRVSFADERGSEERSLSMMSPSASSGSWDEAELIARGLISASDRDMQGESRERREERRRWFRRR